MAAKMPLSVNTRKLCLNAAIWPVWKAEASVSFFHLFFELLYTIQEGHHGMVEFIVPEEPKATWTVQRKFLDKHKTEKRQNWNLDQHLSKVKVELGMIIVYVLPWTCLSVTLSMSGFHMVRDDI